MLTKLKLIKLLKLYIFKSGRYYCISCYFREGFISRISRSRPSRKFPLQFMSIYSNDNIRKIAKLTTRELPHLVQKREITVRENNGLYSIDKLSQTGHLNSTSF